MMHNSLCIPTKIVQDESKFLRWGEIISNVGKKHRALKNYFQTSGMLCGRSQSQLQTPVELIRLQPFQWTEFLTSGISRKRLHGNLRFLLTYVSFCGFRSKTKNPPFGGSVQKLYIALSSASISRDRFLSPSRYCGVNTSLLDSCSSLDATDKRELFSSVSILWTLFRSRVKSSIAIVASYTGGLWSGGAFVVTHGASRFLF